MNGGLVRSVAGLATLLVLLSSSAEGTTYEVGDGLSWLQPPTLTTYSLWASSHVFIKGDNLEFNFNNGIHNVAEVTKEAYNKCNKTSPISIHNQSPVKIPLSKKGKRYFISTLNNDCQNGLKVAIKVLSHLPLSLPPSQPPSTIPAAAPRRANRGPPPPSAALTPPESNSAPSFFGHASALFSLIVGLLCMVLI